MCLGFGLVDDSHKFYVCYWFRSGKMVRDHGQGRSLFFSKHADEDLDQNAQSKPTTTVKGPIPELIKQFCQPGQWVLDLLLSEGNTMCNAR